MKTVFLLASFFTATASASGWDYDRQALGRLGHAELSKLTDQDYSEPISHQNRDVYSWTHSLHHDLTGFPLKDFTEDDLVVGLKVFGQLYARALRAAALSDYTFPEPAAVIESNLLFMVENFVKNDFSAKDDDRFPVYTLHRLSLLADDRPVVESALESFWREIATALRDISLARWAQETTKRKAIRLLELLLPRPSAYAALKEIALANGPLAHVAATAVARHLAKQDPARLLAACEDLLAKI